MITQLQTKTFEELPGTSIAFLEKGECQEVALVHVEPNGEIPLHSHHVDARMTIVAGSARVLSENEDNGVEVQPGYCVFFEREKMHGFKAGPSGLAFLSRNGGIKQQSGKLDIAFA